MNKFDMCEECGYVETDFEGMSKCLRCESDKIMELVIEDVVESEELDKLNTSIGFMAYGIMGLGIVSALVTAIMFVAGISHTAIVYTSLFISALTLGLITIAIIDIVRGVRLREKEGL